MSDRYFMTFGSPGKVHVRGPHRGDHHAGWFELTSFHWVQPRGGSGGAGKATFEALEVSMRASAGSLELQHYGTAGGSFDLVVLEIWNDSPPRSKGKVELRDVMIATYSYGSDREGPMIAFVLSFAGLQMSAGAGPQTAGTRPAAIQSAWARVEPTLRARGRAA